MNILTRKLNFIEEFLRITDESLISKLEVLIKNERKTITDVEIKPMSINELQNMVEEANENYKNGRFTSQSELKKKIKSWN